MTDILGNTQSDSAAFDALIAERVCLERRKTFVIHERDFERWAHMVWMNSHRFRKPGMGDGKVFYLGR
jgi:hypothetical protein